MIKEKHDYTQEIIRCIDTILHHLGQGWSVEDSITKTQGSYGYVITLNARRAIWRHYK